MKQPPNIIIQLVHIEGPLKGEIQDYPMPEIIIGRHSSCHVRFPKDLAVVSRQHARIVREGNRFKIIDQSSNGTYLNGKPIQEAYLKDGDVLMFAEGGPKASFLTQTVAHAPVMQEPEAPQPPPDPAPIAQAQSIRPEPSGPPPRQPFAKAPYVPPPVPPSPAPSPPEPVSPAGVLSGQMPVGPVKKPLIIQYGPTLRSFNELPVTIGQSAQCDFMLNHPAIFERHAQVFYYQDHYWIKDLSGKNPILINGRPVDREAVLEPDCRLSLTSKGPDFRFLGGGRLAEIEEVPAMAPESSLGPEDASPPKSGSPVQGLKNIGGIMKRILNK